jgi:preprotein translocase subunit SecF
LNLGIDFTSGSTVTYQFEGGNPGTDVVTDALARSGHPEAIVQALGDDQYFIRTDDLGVYGLDAINEEVAKLQKAPAKVLDTSTVGASVAEDTVRNAITAVIVAVIFVMLYIMYAFRSVPNSYKYAFAAIVALAHDVLIVLGAFTVLGIAINAEVNAIFIVGILTVIGYSVNDTIVIFDRIRENVTLAPGREFRATVNLSINESITRSLGTSVTTMTVILAILLFGGASLRDFMIVLLAGVMVGTYSSIFVAAQILVLWERRRFLPWRRETVSTS